MSLRGTIAVNRFGLGALPGEIDAASLGPVEWLMEQLDHHPPLLAPQHLNSNEALAVFDRFRNQREKFKAKQTQGPQTDLKVAQKNPSAKIYYRDRLARLKALCQTRSPFAERLSLFWANHLTISARTPFLRILAGSYEREVIRPHIAGTFADMLIASAKHPAMLLYLDNARSVGPNSSFGKWRNRGLNENYARELLELHTLGVDSGYSTQDIRELAKALTGWSLARNPKRSGFSFNKKWHEPGERHVVGRIYKATTSLEIGETILRDLALQEETAHHLAGKLAQHFISDDPGQDVVARLARAYLDHKGALLPVYEALLTHEDAFQPRLGKFKTPLDYIVSTMRGLGVDDQFPFFLQGLETLGQPLWAPPSPQGWPDRQAYWASTDGFKSRLDFAFSIAKKFSFGDSLLGRAQIMLGERLNDNTKIALTRTADPSQGLTLLLMAPEFQYR